MDSILPRFSLVILLLRLEQLCCESVVFINLWTIPEIGDTSIVVAWSAHFLGEDSSNSLMHDNMDICLQPDIVLSSSFFLFFLKKIINRNLSANDNEKRKDFKKSLKDNKKKKIT